MITYKLEVYWNASWVDESAYIERAYIRRGRERGWSSSGREPIRYGEARFTLNNYSRRFDPNYAAGALYGYLLPGKRVRLTATENSVTYAVFAGFVQDIRPGSSRTYKADMLCTDGLYWFSQQECTTVATQTNYPVTSALYDLASMSSFPAISADTFPFTFNLTLSALGLEDNGDTIATWNSAAIEGKTILAAMEEIAIAYSGTIYIDATGNLCYKTRYTSAPESFAITEGNVTDMQLKTPWDVIYNYISVTATTGSAQINSNSTSITAYSKRNLTISNNDFIQTEAHALNLSDHLILVTANKRFELDIRLFGSAAFCFGRDLMDTVSFTGDYSDLASVFFVGGITHEILPAGNTTTTIYLEESQYEYTDLGVFTFTFNLTLGW